MGPAVFFKMPVELLLTNADLFWKIAFVAQKELNGNVVNDLLQLDWSELLAGENQCFVEFVECILESDDAKTLSVIFEALDPKEDKYYFDCIKRISERFPKTSRCYEWMANQGILGSSLDVFKEALWQGQVDAAKKLKTISATEAELIFFEAPQKLNKESASLLFFIAPTLSNHSVLLHALESGASEELCNFIAWKMEHHMSKPDLKYPDGDDKKLKYILSCSLSKSYALVCRKIFEWNKDLAFEPINPDNVIVPWSVGAKNSIKLDGKLSLLPLEWAFLLQLSPLYNPLRNAGVPSVNESKLNSVLQVLSKGFEKIDKESALYWLGEQEKRLKVFLK